MLIQAKTRRKSHDFAKWRPDLLSWFSLRQGITSQSFRLLLLPCWSLEGNVTWVCPRSHTALVPSAKIQGCSIPGCFHLVRVEQLSSLAPHLYYLFSFTSCSVDAMARIIRFRTGTQFAMEVQTWNVLLEDNKPLRTFFHFSGQFDLNR